MLFNDKIGCESFWINSIKNVSLFIFELTTVRSLTWHNVASESKRGIVSNPSYCCRHLENRLVFTSSMWNGSLQRFPVKMLESRWKFLLWIILISLVVPQFLMKITVQLEIRRVLIIKRIKGDFISVDNKHCSIDSWI